MDSECEITIEDDNGKKTFNDSNCNWYQKIWLMLARKEREHMAQLELKHADAIRLLKEANADHETLTTAHQKMQVELLKQLGVVEWIVKQIPICDATKYVNHLFGPDFPEASQVKHA